MLNRPTNIPIPDPSAIEYSGVKMIDRFRIICIVTMITATSGINEMATPKMRVIGSPVGIAINTPINIAMIADITSPGLIVVVGFCLLMVFIRMTLDDYAQRY